MTNNTTNIRLTVTVLVIAMIIWLGVVYPQQLLANLDRLKNLAAHYPIAAPLLFIGIYIAATILIFLPVSFLTLIGGWLFGPVMGSVFNTVGALTGAALAFLVSRHIAGDWVTKHIGARLKVIRDGVSRAGWRFVALVRLAPVLPFNLLNCALGLSEIRFGEYLLATAIFMLPAKIAYTYVGSLGFEFITAPHKSNVIKLVIIGGVVIAVCLIPWLIKYFRRKENTS